MDFAKLTGDYPEPVGSTSNANVLDINTFMLPILQI